MVQEHPSFIIKMPHVVRHPILISAPHVGIDYPAEVRDSFLPDVIVNPQDADWYVHQLYEDIANELGLPMIWACYSRYVVDLNRDPGGQNLYDDGRKETQVVPLQSFGQTPLYNPGSEPTRQEVERRVAAYHQPYYGQIRSILESFKAHYGFRHVLFYDAHSIKRHVPSIRKEPFPDMVLGTNDGKAASQDLVKAALAALQSGAYDVRRDEVFRGGYLTRHFGQPDVGMHALQLERAWDIYLTDDLTRLDPAKATALQMVLRKMLIALTEVLAQKNR